MTQIFSFSLIIWILIDRFKGLWENCKLKSCITSAIALCLGAAVAIYYRLDIVVALGLAENVSTLGIILTALSLMGGSSCVAEIMEKISGSPVELVDISDLIGDDKDDDEEGDDPDAE